jgi:hypothetical protein
MTIDELALDDMAFALSVTAETSLAAGARSRHKVSRAAASDAFFAELGN